MVIRNSYLRTAICFFICIVLIFVQTAEPFTVPARAIAGIDDALILWIIGSLLLSLGVSFAFNTEGTVAAVNSATEWVLDHAYGALETCCEAVANAYVENEDTVTAIIDSGTYTALSNSLADWMRNVGILDAPSGSTTVHVDVPGGQQVIFDTSKAYQLAGGAPKFPTVPSGLSPFDYFGDSVLYFGNGPYTSPVVLPGEQEKGRYTCVRCDHYGGSGKHCCWPAYKLDGNLELPSSCTERDNVSCFPLVLFVHYGDGSDYRVWGLRYWPDGDPDRFRPLAPGAVETAYGFSYTIDPTLLNVPVDVPAGSIDVPIEKDDTYAPGVVIGAWDTVIDRVGAAVGSLPFTFPLTAEGLVGATAADVLPGVLQNEISMDVPVEGDVDLPKVDDLMLPRGIINKFPFCIPFDVVRGLELFAADPVEPVWSVPLTIQGVVDETIQLDLTRFDFIIRLFRWLLLIAFTAMLAAATRFFIKW